MSNQQRPFSSSPFGSFLANLTNMRLLTPPALSIVRTKPKFPGTLFVSYESQDGIQFAKQLQPSLESSGYPVYLDRSNHDLDDGWQESLSEAIQKCFAFVPLVTPMYGCTKWSKRELKLADQLEKHILPVNFLDTWPPKCLAIQLATTQYVQGSLTGAGQIVPTWKQESVDTVTKKIAQQIDKLWTLSKRSMKSHYIMISYARNDAAEHALKLKTELVRLGYKSIYLDVHEIDFGCDWEDSLNQAVQGCTFFIALVTATYGETLWTKREAKTADLLNKRILPVNFLQTWPPRSLAIQFGNLDYIKWPNAGLDVSIKQVAKQLAKRMTK